MTGACPFDRGNPRAHLRAHSRDRDPRRVFAFVRDVDAVLACTPYFDQTGPPDILDGLGLTSRPECVVAFARSLREDEDCGVILDSLNRSRSRARRLESMVSHRLTVLTTLLLPPAERREYEELFNSDLYDLARSGSGHRAQLVHALRVLLRAPLLRRELR